MKNYENNNEFLTEKEVSKIFDGMADEYDELSDLWYSWLFSRLHYIIAKHVINVYDPKDVLDVGCGTGFQSFLHAAAGASVTGIDIADKLIEVAKKKSLTYNPQNGLKLFPVYHNFVSKYNERIFTLLSNKISRKYTPPNFQIADALNLPFENESFDHINCCGSTISFIENHNLSLSEMVRVLKPDGTLFLELESRWNIDILWLFLDVIIRGKLGYDTTLKEAFKTITIDPRKYVMIDYPFGNPENPVYMNIKLFTLNGIKNELKQFHVNVLKKWSIHSVTNLIPSTYLDMSKPPRWFINLFLFLASIEDKNPFYLPGCSLVLLCQKRDNKVNNI